MYKYILPLVTALFIFLSACGDKKNDGSENKTSDNKTTDSKTGEFGWKDGISVSDIPSFPVKGMIEGKEVQFGYVNFEKWRGSNDHVINFSTVKPEQNCGFIENFTGFTIINKGGEIKQGEWIKAKFGDDPKTYEAYFKQNEQKSTASWNCAMNIESITDKQVKGKIAIFFNDEKKSWVAGSFEAALCSN